MPEGKNDFRVSISAISVGEIRGKKAANVTISLRHKDKLVASDTFEIGGKSVRVLEEVSGYINKLNEANYRLFKKYNRQKDIINELPHIKNKDLPQ